MFIKLSKSKEIININFIIRVYKQNDKYFIELNTYDDYEDNRLEVTPKEMKRILINRTI